MSNSVLLLPLFMALTGAATTATNWQALPTQAPSPAANPTTPAKIELGKMLYFDPRLSSTGTVSCFSCHNVMEGGDDHRPTSIGCLMLGKTTRMARSRSQNITGKRQHELRRQDQSRGRSKPHRNRAHAQALTTDLGSMPLLALSVWAHLQRQGDF